MPPGVSERVETLIRQHLNSIEQIEILLLFRRSSHRFWTAGQVSSQLGSVPPSPEEGLVHLAEHGLLRVVPGDEPKYKYGPTTIELGLAVRELGEVYDQQRLAVVDLIFAVLVKNESPFTDETKGIPG